MNAPEGRCWSFIGWRGRSSSNHRPCACLSASCGPLTIVWNVVEASNSTAQASPVLVAMVRAVCTATAKVKSKLSTIS